MIHFELIFMSCEVRMKVNIFAYGRKVCFNIIYKDRLPPLIYLDSFLKSIDIICVVYFWILFCYPDQYVYPYASTTVSSNQVV